MAWPGDGQQGTCLPTPSGPLSRTLSHSPRGAQLLSSQLSKATLAFWVDSVPFSSDPWPPLWVLVLASLPPFLLRPPFLSPPRGPCGSLPDTHPSPRRISTAWPPLGTKQPVRAGPSQAEPGDTAVCRRCGPGGCNSIPGGLWKLGGGRGPASQRWSRTRGPGASVPAGGSQLLPRVEARVAEAGDRCDSHGGRKGHPVLPSVRELPGWDTAEGDGNGRYCQQSPARCDPGKKRETGRVCWAPTLCLKSPRGGQWRTVAQRHPAHLPC